MFLKERRCDCGIGVAGGAVVVELRADTESIKKEVGMDGLREFAQCLWMCLNILAHGDT